MKKIGGMVIVIIFVIFLDFMTEKYTNNSVNEINTKLKLLNANIKENYEDGKFHIDENQTIKIIKMSNEILELWREKDNILSCYIEHDEIEKVSDKMNSFNKQIETQNYNDAVVAIVETEFLLGHITEKQSLKLKNIF